MLGLTFAYARAGKENPALEIRFCPTCGCVLYWRGLWLEKDGRRRMAVNVRLAPPEAVAHLPIDHFEGSTRSTTCRVTGAFPEPA